MRNTFSSKWDGIKGNLTKGNKLSKDRSLFPKSCSVVKEFKSSSTVSQPQLSEAFIDHIKTASRTRSSDVTVISTCCKDHHNLKPSDRLQPNSITKARARNDED